MMLLGTLRCYTGHLVHLVQGEHCTTSHHHCTTYQLVHWRGTYWTAHPAV